MRCLIAQPVHPVAADTLRAAGVEIVEAGPRDRLTDLAPGCSAILTRNARVDGPVMAAAGKALRVVAIHGAGSDGVDLDEATRRGVVVANTPGANARSVAELAIGLAFALARRLPQADAAARAGDFSFKYHARLLELSGLVFGVVGFGAIGQETARIASALGMDVFAHAPRRSHAEVARSGARRAGSLEALLRESDIVSLHLPATDETRGFLGRERFAMMKRGAILLNTGRGETVDEVALCEALADGHLAGAGLDVFSSEPLPPGHPLLARDNVILSPHVGGSTEAALRRTGLASARIVVDVLAGRRPAHLLNPKVLELAR